MNLPIDNPHDALSDNPDAPLRDSTATFIDAGAPGLRLPFFEGGLSLKTATPEVAAAFTSVVDPLYRKTVLQEMDPLARAAGMSVTLLAAIETLEQRALGEQIADNLKSGGRLDEDEIAKYIRLAGAKTRISGFISRISRGGERGKTS